MDVYTFPKDGMHHIWSFDYDKERHEPVKSQKEADIIVDILNDVPTKWINAIENPPLPYTPVIILFGDGETTVGEHTGNTILAHGTEWHVYDCYKKTNVFGVVFWQELP